MKKVGVIFVLALVLMMGFVSAGEIVFEDNFEEGIFNWEIDEYDENCPLEYSCWNPEVDGGNNILEGYAHTWANAIMDEVSMDSFEMRVRMLSGGAHVNFLNNDMGRYYVSLNNESVLLERQYNNWEIFETLEVFEGHGVEPNVWYNLRIEINYDSEQEDHITVYLDDKLVIGNPHMPVYTQGKIAFETLDDSNYWFDDVVLYGERKEIPPVENICENGFCDEYDNIAIPDYICGNGLCEGGVVEKNNYLIYLVILIVIIAVMGLVWFFVYKNSKKSCDWFG